jgi:hypothetical protein
MRKVLGILLVIFVGCSSDVPKTDNGITPSENIDTLTGEFVDEAQKRIATTNDNSFLSCYESLVTAIGTNNDSLFNYFINENHGMYVIESNGAMPSMFKIYEIKDIKKSYKKKSINQLLYHQMERPIFDDLPKVICDTTIYDKQGCFASPVNPLDKSRIWNYANLNEKEIQSIEVLAQTIGMTVVNTLNFTFYFSKIEDKWYLTFLDLRSPCEA